MKRYQLQGEKTQRKMSSAYDTFKGRYQYSDWRHTDYVAVSVNTFLSLFLTANLEYRLAYKHRQLSSR